MAESAHSTLEADFAFQSAKTAGALDALAARVEQVATGAGGLAYNSESHLAAAKARVEASVGEQTAFFGLQLAELRS